jgi:putative hydrolase of the HAD superfamily
MRGCFERNGLYFFEPAIYCYTQLSFDMKTSNPEILILDFGGVIYQISHQKQKETFAQLGIHNFDELYSQAKQSPLFADLERGHISNEDFITAVSGFIGGGFGVDKILKAWNSILVDFPEENVSFVESLKDHYQLYLLSNTNSIHYDIYIKQFTEKFGYDFNSLFKKAFWSFKIGKRKPDAEIYEFVKAEIGIDPSKMLFVDDTEVNITASRDAGVPAYWLKPGEKLNDLFGQDFNLLAKV